MDLSITNINIDGNDVYSVSWITTPDGYPLSTDMVIPSPINVHIDKYDPNNNDDKVAIITVETDDGVTKDIEINRCSPDCTCNIFNIACEDNSAVKASGGSVKFKYTIKKNFDVGCNSNYLTCTTDSSFVTIKKTYNGDTFTATFGSNDGEPRSAKIQFSYFGVACKQFTISQGGKNEITPKPSGDCDEKIKISTDAAGILCEGESIRFTSEILCDYTAQGLTLSNDKTGNAQIGVISSNNGCEDEWTVVSNSNPNFIDTDSITVNGNIVNGDIVGESRGTRQTDIVVRNSRITKTISVTQSEEQQPTPQPGNGITFRIENNSGKDAWFSGKLTLYVKQGRTQDVWNHGVAFHLNAPESSRGGWPHWELNKYHLVPGASTSFTFNKIVDYNGTGVDGKLNVTETPLSKYTSGNYYFVASDSGGINAIKLGHSEKAPQSESGVSNKAYFVLVKPLSDNKPISETTYVLSIYDIENNEKYLPANGMPTDAGSVIHNPLQVGDYRTWLYPDGKKCKATFTGYVNGSEKWDKKYNI